MKQLVVKGHAQVRENPYIHSWCSKTKQILEIHDLHTAWLNPERCADIDTDKWKEYVANKVNIHYDNKRAQKLRNQRSTSNYREIKCWEQTPRHRCFSMGEQERFGMLNTENYLDDLRDPIGRKLKTLARLDALPLMDKIAKQLQWNPNRITKRWMCPLCGKDKENIQHFFLDCESLKLHRQKLMSMVVYSLIMAQESHYHRRVKSKHNWWAPTVPRLCPPTNQDGRLEEAPPMTAEMFASLQPLEKIQVLLGKQIGCPTVEKHIDTHVKRFLRKSWRLRRPHVTITNEKYGRHDYLIAF